MCVFDDHRQFLSCNVFSIVVGDIVTGRTSVPYVLPKDVSSVTVFLVTRDGLRLSKVRSKQPSKQTVSQLTLSYLLRATAYFSPATCWVSPPHHVPCFLRPTH